MQYRKYRGIKSYTTGKRKVGIRLLLCLICVWIMVFFCLNLEHFFRRFEGDTETRDLVLTGELAGYLQIIPLSPFETRKLLLKEMGEYLTGEDICQMIDFLCLGEGGEVFKNQFRGHSKEKVSRREWCEIYEEILDLLGLRDQVQKISIQYLGMLRQEGRLMADNGNYDCDTESIHFEYGKCYEVYISGRKFLGRAVEIQQQEQAPESDQKEGQQMSDENIQHFNMEIPERVRVLVTQMHPGEISNENVYLDCDGSFLIKDTSGKLLDEKSGSEILDCGSYLESGDLSEIVVVRKDNGDMNLTDQNGTVLSGNYFGQFHIYREDGELFVINEVNLEEYLCGVVPGEMPESFEKEALKAQAVCARTYAVRQLQERKYQAYGADLIDTTDCQVYLPEKKNQNAADAVRETRGQILSLGNELAEIYYFSTSCGFTNGMEVWQLEEQQNIRTVNLFSVSQMIPGETISYEDFFKRKDLVAFDSDSRFFRWSAQISMEEIGKEIAQLIQQEIQRRSGGVGIENPEGEEIASVQALGDFTGVEVGHRNTAGTVIDLVFSFSEGKVHLYHENGIRTILGKMVKGLVDKNGQEVHNMSMLPSASFYMETDSYGNLMLYGGGLGHGIGMSQYGADGMAKAGMTYKEILKAFFVDSQITDLF